MKIDKEIIAPGLLRETDLATLQFIKDSSYFESHYPRLANDAKNYYFQSVGKGPLSSLAFESDLEICLERRSERMGKAHLGAEIRFRNTKEYDQLTYSLTICWNRNPKDRLVRKFHFDCGLPDPMQRQPHPVYHLQYGGNLSIGLKSLDLEHEHIDSWLSEPRIYFIPMSLALLINLVLKEFPDENSQGIIERREWREHVKKNEKLILAPYYKACHNFISLNSSERLLTNDFFYGK